MAVAGVLGAMQEGALLDKGCPGQAQREMGSEPSVRFWQRTSQNQRHVRGSSAQSASPHVPPSPLSMARGSPDLGVRRARDRLSLCLSPS